MKIKVFVFIFFVITSLLSSCTQMASGYRKTPDNFVVDPYLRVEPILNGDQAYTYEPIQLLLISEDKAVEITAIDVFTYNSISNQWEEIEFISTPKPDQIPLIMSSDPQVVILTPKIIDDGNTHLIRLIFSTSQNKGQLVDLTIKPFPLDAASISIKSQLPEVMKLAQEWDQDAYLSEVRIFVPQNKETELILMTFVFHSSQSNTIMCLIDRYKNGYYQTTKGYFPNGIERSRQLEIDHVEIDGQDALGIVLQEASIQIPADHCFELNLQNNPTTDQQNWILLESDCDGAPHNTMTIDSITGEVKKSTAP